MNIVRFPGDSALLANILFDLEKALSTGRDVSLCTGTNNIGPWLKYKIGEGMWSPPLYSKVD